MAPTETIPTSKWPSNDECGSAAEALKQSRGEEAPTVTEPAEQPAKPLRTWRPMALWSAAILAALGLTWFVGAVVVPMVLTHRALERGGADNEINGEAVIAELGGPERAARRLTGYLRLPDRLASRRAVAAYELGLCERRAVPALLGCLSDPNPDVRAMAAVGLELAEATPEEAVPGLAGLLRDANANVQCNAAQALAGLAFTAGNHGGVPPVFDIAVPALEKMAADKREPEGIPTAAAAALALEKIRGDAK